MMSNVAWPKWKIYYDFLHQLYNVYLEGKPKFREKKLLVKLSFIVQIALGDARWENVGWNFFGISRALAFY